MEEEKVKRNGEKNAIVMLTKRFTTATPTANLFDFIEAICTHRSWSGSKLIKKNQINLLETNQIGIFFTIQPNCGIHFLMSRRPRKGIRPSPPRPHDFSEHS